MAAQKVYEAWERELIERGIERGMERGMERGKTLGLDEGKRDMLLRLLRVKFEKLPTWVAEKINAASVQELDTWAERVVTRASLEDVFGQD